jgi:hypothetical protein
VCNLNEAKNFQKEKMKNLLLILTVLITLSGFGQNQFIGVKSGLNWSTLRSNNFTSDLGEVNYRSGFHLGLSYDYRVNNKFSLGVDLIYFNKGFIERTEFPNDFRSPAGLRGTTSTIEYSYDYFSIPIKGGVVFGNKLSGYSNLGIIPSLFINSETETSSASISIIGEDEVRPFDIAALLELGALYNISGSFFFQFSIAFQHSFTSITHEGFLPDAEGRYSDIVLSVGLKYALKKE